MNIRLLIMLASIISFSADLFANCMTLKFPLKAGGGKGGIYNIEYDTEKGVSFFADVDGFGGQKAVKWAIPLADEKGPNPHFDRLYALLLKNVDFRHDMTVCDKETTPFPDRYEQWFTMDPASMPGTVLKEGKTFIVSRLALELNSNAKPRPVSICNFFDFLPFDCAKIVGQEMKVYTSP